MRARYSNDRFRAPHRVINRDDRSRYTCPYLGPSHDALVESVPTCVGAGGSGEYGEKAKGALD